MSTLPLFLNKLNLQKRLTELLQSEHFIEQIVETHISVVILGKELVVKFKKPVTFSFLDYSSIDKRWYFCCQEICLNRQLSSGIYLGVLPFFESFKSASLSDIITNPVPASPPKGLVEAAVIMTRLPETERLDKIIQQSPDMAYYTIKNTAQKLAAYHKPTLVRGDIFNNSLEKNVMDNFSIIKAKAKTLLSATDKQVLSEVENYSMNFLSSNHNKILDRAKKEYIIAGHGDLRLEHIYQSPSGTQIIDCVEFNATLRQDDFLSELAFLKMELDLVNWPAHSKQFIKAYIDKTQKDCDFKLLNFYACYRAMVRAKVELLSCKTMEDKNNTLSAFRNRLGLASRYAHSVDFTFVICLAGVMGVGKSTLADYLWTMTAVPILSSDKTRKALFGKSSKDKTLAFGKGKYDLSSSMKTYETMSEKLTSLLKQGNPVVIDASFSKQQYRDIIYKVTSQLHCPLLWIDCKLTHSEIINRLKSRAKSLNTISDGRVELLDEQLRDFENIRIDDKSHYLEVNMKNSPQQLGADILQKVTKLPL